ncbi:hypothetical protein M513_04136 [Trichuris suis]|uniref:Peptidase A2 domain-containing protein n=1 Tax=Trichuris suis TaxID=68888 RepID=A0A085MCK8_9BILA|nr:hypothetical protein M513_04136 [Trichuris suis]
MKRCASLNSFFAPASVEQCKAPSSRRDVKPDLIKMQRPPLDPLCVDTSFQPDGEPSTSLCANLQTPSRFTNEVLKLQRERKANVERAIALADEQLTFITQLISSNDEGFDVCSSDCRPPICSDMNLFAEVSLLRAQCKKLCDDVERLKSRRMGATVMAPVRLCIVCDPDSHSITSCPIFSNMDITDRLKVVHQRRLCLRCLKPGQLKQDCKSKEKCSVCGCRGTQRPLLHGAPRMYLNQDLRQSPLAITSPGQHQASITTTRVNCQPKKVRVLCAGVPVLATFGLTAYTVYALLDSGAEVSMASSQLSRRLNIQGKKPMFNVHTINGMPQFSVMESECMISSVDRCVSFKVDPVIVVPNMDLSPSAQSAVSFAIKLGPSNCRLRIGRRYSSSGENGAREEATPLFTAWVCLSPSCCVYAHPLLESCLPRFRQARRLNRRST